MYIKPKDLERYGLIRECNKCDHERNYGPGRTAAGHSNICRERIMKELAKTDEGQARIAAAAVRLDMTVSELGQQHRGAPGGDCAGGADGAASAREPHTFVPITESKTIRLLKCESVEAPSHHTDEAGLVETHGEPAHHGVLDMGFDESRPQELVGMEIDAITADDSDLADVLKTMTRDAKAEMSTVNREMMSDIRALGRDHQKYERERERERTISCREGDRVRDLPTSEAESGDHAIA